MIEVNGEQINAESPADRAKIINMMRETLCIRNPVMSALMSIAVLPFMKDALMKALMDAGAPEPIAKRISMFASLGAVVVSDYEIRHIQEEMTKNAKPKEG